MKSKPQSSTTSWSCLSTWRTILLISTHVRSRQDDKGDYADLTNPTFYALHRAMSWLHSLIQLDNTTAHTQIPRSRVLRLSVV
jgi:hypothetical protein